MRKNNNKENYLLNIPVRQPLIKWSIDENELVTLEIDNKGFFNVLAQKIFKKPKISYVHLDEFGSYVWTVTDGEKSITEIGVEVKARFGEKAEPLYERLAKYYQILYSYKFILWK